MSPNGLDLYAIERDTFVTRRYNGTGTSWQRLTDSLSQHTLGLVITTHYLYGQSSGKQNLWRTNDLGKQPWKWELVATDVIRIAATGNSVYWTDLKNVWQLKD
jgi:hypothetical protein